MPSFVVQFDAPQEVTPSGLDGRKFRFPLTIYDRERIGTPRQTQNSRASRVDVAISGSRLAVWNLDDAALRKALFQIAKEHLQSALSTGSSLESELAISVNSHTHPGPCPFDVKLIEEPAGAVLEVEASRPVGFIWNRDA